VHDARAVGIDLDALRAGAELQVDALVAQAGGERRDELGILARQDPGMSCRTVTAIPSRTNAWRSSIAIGRRR
jgi:hypothetical protein